MVHFFYRKVSPPGVEGKDGAADEGTLNPRVAFWGRALVHPGVKDPRRRVSENGLWPFEILLGGTQS